MKFGLLIEYNMKNIFFYQKIDQKEFKINIHKVLPRSYFFKVLEISADISKV